MDKSYRGLFIVGVRLMGVWILIDALRSYLGILETLFGWLERYQGHLPSFFLSAFVETIVGMYLLFYAHRLAALVYPQPEAKDEGYDAPAASDEAAGGPSSPDKPSE